MLIQTNIFLCAKAPLGNMKTVALEKHFKKKAM